MYRLIEKSQDPSYTWDTRLKGVGIFPIAVKMANLYS